MQWNQLLSAFRLGEEIRLPYDELKYPMSEFEKDYWRIISSASFRRLQDKTQVFPLDSSDFVRTRLTHSYETSSLSRQLTTMITENIVRYHSDTAYKITSQEARTAAEISACAGLLHDVGNPPFGHFGEEVIGAWFQENLHRFDYRGKPICDLLTNGMKKDLFYFEGNAQAVRLLTKLHFLDSDKGLNLTSAVLHTLVKYPTSSSFFSVGDEDIKNHKFGYFESEKNEMERIAKAVGTDLKDGGCRHPLTFILEAADDIAYATADLEDGYKKGLFSIDMIVDFFNAQLKAMKNKGKVNDDQYDKSTRLITELISLRKKFRKQHKVVQTTDLLAFQNWISFVRHWLLYAAAFGFTEQQTYIKIMEGSCKNDIFHGTFHYGSIQILKKATAKFIFSERGILKLELAAQSILNSLLEKYVPAVIYFDEENAPHKSDRYTQTKAQKKMTDLISQNQKENYMREKTKDTTHNLYLRLLLATDYISGMTDSFAKNQYRELSGIY